MMCSSRLYPHSPHRGDWYFQGGGGQFCKTKKLKECMKLNQNFQMGRRVLGKILSVGGYGYFLEPHNIFFLLPFLAPVV